MPSRNGPAPTVAELQAYGLGKLGPQQAAEVESFLADHPECGTVLAATPDDEVVRLLRGAGDLLATDRPDEETSAAPPSPPPDWPTALAGHARYRLVRKLGEGGMGTVFLAEHRLMQRPVALKVIRAHCLPHPQARERFRREVQAAAGLSHPNVVTAYDAEEAHGTHFLVMEYVAGVSLDRWLAEHGPLPVAEACGYVRQAALGLQYAHEKGMVHRDLKPHNLMRTPDGTVKILDFGLARLAWESDDSGPLTAPGAVMGTADYMAPEQGQDSRTADVRADVYSLGCTLYQLLTGRLPFPEGTAVQKIFQHSLDRPQPLAGLRPDVHAGLVRVVETMMARRPAERYQTPAEVAAALEPFAHPAAVKPPRKGRRLRVAVAAALLLAGVGIAAGVVYRIQTDEGEVVITPQSPDVEIVLLKGGKEFQVFDTKTRKRVTVPVGTYDVAVKDRPDDLEVKTDRVTISRGREALVVVERVARPATSVAPLPDKVGLIRRFPQTANAMGHAPIFSPDGRLMALTVDDRPTDVAFKRVVETATGRLVRQVGYAGEGITDAAFTADNRHVLTGSRTTVRATFAFRLWDLVSDEVRELTIESPADWPDHFHLSTDGRLLAMSVYGPQQTAGTRVVETATGKVVLDVPAPPGKPWVAEYTRFSADGRWAVTSAEWADKPHGRFVAGRLRVDDLTGGTAPRIAEVEGQIVYPFFTADGRQVGGHCYHDADGLAIDYWDRDSLKLTRRVPLVKAEDYRNYVPGFGRRAVVLWKKDGAVRVLECGDGREVYRTEPVEGSPSLSPDGRVLVVCDKTECRLYRLPDPREP